MMPEFVLDTEGYVERHDGARLHWYDDLTPFVQGFIEAMFFTSDDELGDRGFMAIAPETLARIIEDCAKFQAGAAYVAMKADKRRNAGGLGSRDHNATQAGRDFWYTRNGHGCGFWDGDWPEPYATALTEAARAFGSVDAYLGDDGKVYLS